MDFRQLLFPVDFSDRSISAARYVRAIAELFRSQLTLVHAVDDPLKWYGSPTPVTVVEVDLPKALHESEECLKRFADTHFPHIEVACVVEIAGPSELIEKTAQRLNPDLIVMPTHGRGRFRAALLGSVTAKILHDLPMPVWTDTHQEDSSDHWPIKRVACAIDLGSESVKVLRFAADFANRCRAETVIVHGVPLGEMRLGPYSKIEPPTYMEDFARSEIEHLQQEAGTTADVHIESGPIGSVVRNAALERDAGLVIIGRGPIHPAVFRGHTYSIICNAPCPVLSV